MEDYRPEDLNQPGIDLTQVKSLVFSYTYSDPLVDIPWERLTHIEKIELVNYPFYRIPWESLTALRVLNLVHYYNDITLDDAVGLKASIVVVRHTRSFRTGKEVGERARNKITKLIICDVDNVIFENPFNYPLLHSVSVKNAITLEGYWNFTQIRELAISDERKSNLHLRITSLHHTIMGSNLTLLDPPFQYPVSDRWEINGPGLGMTQSYLQLTVPRNRKKTAGIELAIPEKRATVPKRHMYEVDTNMTLTLAELSGRIMELRSRHGKHWFDPVKRSLADLRTVRLDWSENNPLSLQEIQEYIFAMLSDPRIHPIYFATNLGLFHLLNLHLIKSWELVSKIAGLNRGEESCCQRLRELITKKITHPLHVWYALMVGFGKKEGYLEDPELTNPCVMRNVLTAIKVNEWNIPGELRNLLWSALLSC